MNDKITGQRDTGHTGFYGDPKNIALAVGITLAVLVLWGMSPLFLLGTAFVPDGPDRFPPFFVRAGVLNAALVALYLTIRFNPACSRIARYDRTRNGMNDIVVVGLAVHTVGVVFVEWLVSGRIGTLPTIATVLAWFVMVFMVYAAVLRLVVGLVKMMYNRVIHGRVDGS